MNKPRFLISACLAGVPCRYDGNSKPHPLIAELVAKGDAILVCPEVLGGLPIPRIPCERVGKGVINRHGEDKSEEFYHGAAKTLEIAKNSAIECVIFKSQSPSCGVREIYDGTFSGRLIPGMGVTAELLHQKGFLIIEEADLEEPWVKKLLSTNPQPGQEESKEQRV